MIVRRLVPAFVLAAGLLAGPLAGAALAHVEAASPGAARGGSGTVTFSAEAEEQVPLTRLDVALPTDTPLLDVTVPPVAGWTSSTVTAPSADGSSSVVSRVTWMAAGDGIAPGGTGRFVIRVGRFPDAAQVVFKALVAYANGQVVSWIELPAPGAPEPELPAPVLALAPGAPASSPAAVAVTAEAAPTAAPAPAAQPAGTGGSGGAIATGVVVVLVLGAGAASLARRRAR